jgi:predicted GNAT family acetyltransferase
MADLTFKVVDRQTWGDFERLFESRGGPKSCWCMVWRANPEESRHTDGKSRKGFIRKRIIAGIPVGILGYKDREPIAWCSIAPKETYRNLTGKAATRRENAWSLACFFIKREFRKQGLVPQLIGAAIKYAKQNGAQVVEAYPVEHDSPSYRFMGQVDTFTEIGFTQIGKAGSRRHIMVLEV